MHDRRRRALIYCWHAFGKTKTAEQIRTVKLDNSSVDNYKAFLHLIFAIHQINRKFCFVAMDRIHLSIVRYLWISMIRCAYSGYVAFVYHIFIQQKPTYLRWLRTFSNFRLLPLLRLLCMRSLFNTFFHCLWFIHCLGLSILPFSFFFSSSFLSSLAS